MKKVQVKIKMLPGYEQFKPTKGSEHAAGWDLRAVIYEPLRITSNPVLVKCGFQIEIPDGYQAEIRSRSGLALKGIVVANSPGTIDSDYRGEVGVILMNHDPDHVYGINPGDRIAQMVIMPVPAVELVYVDELGETARGAGGFGSTGIK